ncbi:MAG: methionine adenosyltransferase [Armatimonadota bacterium]|jgi:S-adenosylmethionine synthetase
MEIVVTEPRQVVQPIEIVERKGVGHPDTLADRAAEELSRALSEWYLEEHGHVLHHNLDKVLLVGGKSQPRFGGGEIIEPPYLLLSGRATGEVEGRETPIGRLAVERTQAWLSELDLLFIVDYRIKSGSSDLTCLTQGEVPLANDTSYGVAYSPLTETEQLVLHTEELLNARETKRLWPMLGTDVKVMGVRTGDFIHLTVAVAFIDRHVPDRAAYEQVKREVADFIKAHTACAVTVNAADAEECYLTVSGTSAECGDDGQVGRGNRINGLITPMRPMSLEAAAGKNPVCHVGKLYQVMARLIVERLEEAMCVMVSQIGAPITEPQVVLVETSVEERKVREVVEDVLSEWREMQRGIIEGRYRLF